MYHIFIITRFEAKRKGAGRNLHTNKIKKDGITPSYNYPLLILNYEQTLLLERCSPQ